MIETISHHFMPGRYKRIGSIAAREFRQQRAPFVVNERVPIRPPESLRSLGSEGGA
jgi:hypothetical protein